MEGNANIYGSKIKNSYICNMANAKLNKINRSLRSYGFDNDVLKMIPDVAYVRIKPDIKNKKGYYITVVQEATEATDIIEYFTERFNKKFSKKNIKGKITFEGYSFGKNKGKDVSIIRFYYKANMFERKLI